MRYHHPPESHREGRLGGRYHRDGIAAGEDFLFGLCAKGINFGLGDEIVGPDYVDLVAL